MLTFMDSEFDGRSVILVAIDFSETSLRALRVARDIAKARPGAELHLAHVLAPLRGPLGLGQASTESLEAMAAIDKASLELDALCEEAEPDASARVLGHVRIGEAAREIVQLASDIAADLVIVGTHGRTGIERVLIGSVAEEVVRRAPSPVLAVKPKKLAPWTQIEPPCPDCVKIQRESQGEKLFCETHAESSRPQGRVHRHIAPLGSKWTFGM